MIVNFKHKGLKNLYEKGEKKGVPSDQVEKIERILARLDYTNHPDDIKLPRFGLHRLIGNLKGFYAVKVTGNLRIIFRFKDNEVCDVNLVDYH